jgi:hypothetical protein
VPDFGNLRCWAGLWWSPEGDLRGPGVSLKKSTRSKARGNRESSAQNLGVGNAGREKEKASAFIVRRVRRSSHQQGRRSN